MGRRVAGLDLAGSPRRPSGLALVEEGVLVWAGVLHGDEELLDAILRFRPMVVAVDAPLSHAKGYRAVDKLMIRMGFKVLPPGWRGMRMLVERAIRIKEALETHGITVIETHPLSAVRSSSASSHVDAASRFIRVPCRLPSVKDVADAAVCAAVAWAYLEGRTIVVKEVDGEIHLLPPERP